MADRLDAGSRLLTDESQLIRLAGLAHHVYGDHLADRPGGLACQQWLGRHPLHAADGASGAAQRRFMASLRLSDGEAGVLDAFGPSDRIRVLALATSNLVDEDLSRAESLFRAALALVEQAQLPDDDDMHADLALTGHNLASALERRPDLSEGALTLMLLGAHTAHRHWGLIGPWTELHCAEYRLAHSWRKFGDLGRARQHAQAGLDLAEAHGCPASERLRSWEALGLVAQAAGDLSGHARGGARAQQAFIELDARSQQRHAIHLKSLGAA